jgi:hypothetical protein
MNGTIEIFTGNLGSGKSYLAVERSMGRLLRGGTVYTNVEMVPDEVAAWIAAKGYEWIPGRLRPLEGELDKFHTQLQRGTAENPVMCVIDEGHLTFNARDWAKTDRGLLNFASLARKLDINLIFITQVHTNLDKQFRGLANWVWTCRNLAQYKIFGIIPCPIPLMFRTCYANDQGKLKREYSDFGPRKKDLCKCYRSDALLGGMAGQFASMAVADFGKLKKIEKPNQESKIPWEVFFGALASAFWVAFSGL